MPLSTMRKYILTLSACSTAVMVFLTVNACTQAPEKAETPFLNTSLMKLAVIPGDYEVGEIAFSPDGRRVAYAAKKDGTSFVVFDNKSGKAYEGGIADMVFSPDSRRFAYRAADGESNHYLVLDGNEIARSRNLGTPVFSPDSSMIGYEANKGEKYVMVAGGRESPAFDMPYAPPLFSANSKRIAYIEQHYDVSKSNIIVCNTDMTDRRKGKDYDLLRDITLSADRSLIAYIAKKKDKFLVVTVDFTRRELVEREGALYDEVYALAISPDNKRVAYLAKRNGKTFFMFDGREQPYPADDITVSPQFSRDGKRIFSVGVRGGQSVVVLDGKAGPKYDEIGRPAISPDGLHIAYPARSGQRWFIVVDNRAGRDFYDMIVSPQFSPDSARVIYRARKAGKRFVITADKNSRTVQRHPEYEMVWQPVFTPEGQSIGYGVKSGRELLWIVDPVK